MLIGILSDSHGRTETTALAVRAVGERGAELVLHLGDIETEAVIDELAAANARIVFGNCDWDTDRLRRYAEGAGVTVDHPMGMLEVAGKRIAWTHGHLDHLMAEALDAGVDYLFHGHSHELRDERIGSTRVINPGALFRARRYTAALLDPASDTLSIVEVTRRS